MMPLTSEEIRHVASEAAKQAVRELLVAMGVDANDPKALIEMQKDFAHIRKWRESVDAIGLKAMLVAVGVIVSGVAGAVWMAVKGGGH